MELNIKPFDTVVNFNEDFLSGSKILTKSPCPLDPSEFYYSFPSLTHINHMNRRVQSCSFLWSGSFMVRNYSQPPQHRLSPKLLSYDGMCLLSTSPSWLHRRKTYSPPLRDQSELILINRPLRSSASMLNIPASFADNHVTADVFYNCYDGSMQDCQNKNNEDKPNRNNGDNGILVQNSVSWHSDLSPKIIQTIDGTDKCTYQLSDDNETYNFTVRKYEIEVSDLKQKLEQQIRETEKVTHELDTMKRQEQARLDELSRCETMKSDTVNFLKRKIAELYADAEVLRCAHSQALDHQADMQIEITDLKQSRNWYAEQLRFVQSSRNRTQTESDKITALLKESRDINHRLAHENACLQAELACSRASLADARRNISRQLESVKVDVVEREAIFERIAAERASFEAVCRQKASHIDDLQKRICTLQADLKFAEEQVVFYKNKLLDTELTIDSSESQRRLLQDKVVTMENMILQKDNQLDEQAAKYNACLVRLNVLERISHDKDVLLDEALSEKASLASAYYAIQQEKDFLDRYLLTLKNSLNCVEDSFSKLRYELDSKTVQITEPTNQRDCLTAKISSLKVSANESDFINSNLKHEKQKLTSAPQLMQLGDSDYCSRVTQLDQSLGRPTTNVSCQVSFCCSTEVLGHLVSPSVAKLNGNLTKVSDLNVASTLKTFESHRDAHTQTLKADIHSSDQSPICSVLKTENHKQQNFRNLNYEVDIHPHSETIYHDNMNCVSRIVESGLTPCIIPLSCKSDLVTDTLHSVMSQNGRLITSLGSYSKVVNLNELTAGVDLYKPCTCLVDASNHFDLVSTTCTSKTTDQLLSTLFAQVREHPANRVMILGREDIKLVPEVCGSSWDSIKDSFEDSIHSTVNFPAVDFSSLRILEKGQSIRFGVTPKTIQDIVQADSTVSHPQFESQLAVLELGSTVNQNKVDARENVFIERGANRAKISELQLTIEGLQQDIRFAKEEMASLQSRHGAASMAHAEELEALREILQTTTDYLVSLITLLKKTQREKALLQNELAQLKKGQRTLLKKYRLFARPDLLRDCVESDNSVQAALKSAGFTFDHLEALFVEETDLPLPYNMLVNKSHRCLNDLQDEITNLKAQVIQYILPSDNSVTQLQHLDGTSYAPIAYHQAMTIGIDS